jgi:hypothetical protein
MALYVGQNEKLDMLNVFFLLGGIKRQFIFALIPISTRTWATPLKCLSASREALMALAGQWWYSLDALLNFTQCFRDVTRPQH